MSDDALERMLRQSLYRFDCPDAHTLGEYELDLLEASERTRIAAHAVECAECTAELGVLRSFLAAPTRVPEPIGPRARRMVATLFTPRAGLAYGGLRGSGDASTRLYEAGSVTVTLGPGSAPGSILGLVVAGDAETGFDSGEVRLLHADATVLRTQMDDLGNFELADLATGTYALEIDVPDGVVVIEDLAVD